jgi:hypothetical protein
MECHLAAGTLQRFLQPVDVGLGLVLVVVGKVTEVSGSRAAEVAAPRPVKEDDGTNVLGIGGGQL